MLVCFLWVQSGFAASAPYYVDVNIGQDATGYGDSPALPFKTLQYAIGEMSSGGILYVMAGTYSDSTHGSIPYQLEIPAGGTHDGIQIIGDPDGTTPEISYEPVGNDGTPWQTGLMIYADNVVIRNLSFNNFPHTGILINGADCTIDECSIDACGDSGILLNDFASSSSERDEYLIRNCSISGTGGGAAILNLAFGSYDPAYGIQNVTISAIAGGQGIYYTDDGGGGAVWGGTISGCDGNGIWINTFDAVIVDGCDINGNGANGILVAESNIGSSIQNSCQIYSNANGVSIDGNQCTIDACSFYENREYGIAISHLSIATPNNVIQNNCNIYANDYGGIKIDNSPNNIIRENRGVFGDNGAGEVSSHAGIHVVGSGATNNVIFDNTIEGDPESYQYYGIYLDAMGNNSGIRIGGNLIATHEYGIYMIASGCEIFGNTFVDDSTAIYIAPGTTTASPDIWNNLMISGADQNFYTGIDVNMGEGGGTFDGSILHNTISGAFADGINIQAEGGGITTPSIYYNIIVSYGTGINYYTGSPLTTFGYNDIFGLGQGVAFYNCAEVETNMFVDPLFVDDDPLSGDEGTDFNLTAGSPWSPCIDVVPSVAGDTVGNDIENTIRPFDAAGVDHGIDPAFPGVYDLGCYEYSEPVTVTDTDDDGLPDSVENASTCLSANNPDSDGDLILDGTEDADHDGIFDDGETDPCDPDTDKDGIDDGVEDANQNGWQDGVETDPRLPDMDDDGFHDGEDTDPLTSGVYPILMPGEYWVNPDSTLDFLGLGTMSEPWNSLHRAVHHINRGDPGAYTIYVNVGACKVVAMGGHEPDEVLMITQDNLTIQGEGIGNTIIDGSNAGLWVDGLDVHGATNVSMINIEVKNFFASGIHMGGAVAGIVDTCSLHDNGNSGVIIEDNGAIVTTPNYSVNNIVRNQCKIYNNAVSGISIRDGIGNQITGNVASIYDNGASMTPGIGIYIFGSVSENNVVTNNHVYYSNNDPNHVQAIGIRINGGGAGNQVVGNTIYGHNSTDSGFGIEVVDSDAQIKQNILFDNAQGIRVSCEPAGNADPEIWNNLIYDGPASDMNYGIFLDVVGGGDVSPSIYHNTIDGGANDGIFISVLNSTASPMISFNIISNFDEIGINNSGGNSSIEMNNVWHNTLGDYAFETPGSGGISVFPNYADEASGDYHLQNTSECINAIAVPTEPPSHPVNDDLEGISRPQSAVSGSYDMGCYEIILDTYTLTYAAGQNGSITGDSPQTVAYGGRGTAVTAVPSTGYHFVKWSDGSEINPRTDSSVTDNISVTATFAIDSYTLTYTAGENGSITGASPQTVAYGGSGTVVTAVPFTGYHFVQWSDGVTSSTRTDTGVTGNITVTAVFEINAYTLTYTVDSNGSITGTSLQTVAHGGDGSSVEAMPVTGYHFVGWSDGLTVNPRTDTNVTGNIFVEATFAINAYTLTYTAGENGSVTGTSLQTVAYGGDGSSVEAVPAMGYHFVQWSDESTENPRTDTNVTADITVMAVFAINEYALTYTAGENGSVTGISPQTVAHGGDGTSVTAVPATGYDFVEWSDGPTANPRTDTNVISDIFVTAEFSISMYWLSVNSGNGTGTYQYNQSVAIAANIPEASQVFDQWTGDTFILKNHHLPNTMAHIPDMDVSVTAIYKFMESEPYTLMVYEGSGSGSYLAGAVVLLVADPPPDGYVFEQWVGDTENLVNVNLPATSLYMPSVDVELTAVYKINDDTEYVLMVNNGTGSGSYFPGEVVPLVADPPPDGYVFDQWVGDTGNLVNANLPETSLLMSADVDLTVVYKFQGETGYDLTVNDGMGSGNYLSGTDVNIEASIPAGKYFIQWLGQNATIADPYSSATTLYMPLADTTVLPELGASIYTLTYTAGANGSIDGISPQTVPHGVSGTSVTAVPSTGYDFVEWSDGSTANPRTDSNVTADMSMTANFAVNQSANAPELISPIGNEAVDPGAVTLFAGDFYDPEGDAHKESSWQIRRFGETDWFPDDLLDDPSSSDLTQHIMKNVLEEGVQYEWRVGYVDAGSQITVWSGQESFIAGTTVDDNNIPAIPPGFEMKDYRLMSFISGRRTFLF
jgi:hypothetical protein